MNEIICPHCKKAFKIDEAGYADILSQVRTAEFDKALNERLEMAEKEKESAVKLAEAKTKNELQATLAQKEAELEKMKAQRDADIRLLKTKIDAAETEKKLALSDAVNKLEKEVAKPKPANQKPHKSSKQAKSTNKLTHV